MVRKRLSRAQRLFRRARIDPPHRAAVRVVKTLTRTGMLGGALANNPLATLRVATKGGLGVRTIHTLHATRTPSRLALIDSKRGISYGAMDVLINRFANALRLRFGVGAGSKVALMLENRADYVVAWFALFRLGAVGVHVEHTATAVELRNLLIRSGSKVLLVSRHSRPTAESMLVSGDVPPLGIVDVDDGESSDGRFVALSELLREASPTPPPSDSETIRSDNVVYTSGTTGQPKGAVRDFAAHGLVELTRVLDRLPLRVGDRHLIVAPLHHSGGQVFTLINAALGATIYVIDHFDPSVCLSMLSRERINSAFMVPTMVRRLLDLSADEHAANPTPHLRALICGAAPFPHALRVRAMERFGEDRLFDFYGATELGWVTLISGPEMLSHPGSVGRPIAGQEVRILDEQGDRVPPGRAGRIFVRSAQTMEGYLHDEAATRRTRIGDWMTVDDLGYVDEQGYLYLGGRARDMVISGGLNIYPLEVEEALIQHPDIRDIAVLGVPDEDWGERLVAMVVPHSPDGFDAQQVTTWGRERLASYKLPRQWHVVDELPRNPTGKVLKRELRERLIAEGACSAS